MIQYPDYITKEDIESFLESKFSGKVDSLSNDAGVELVIRVRRDLVPHLTVNTFDRYIRVEVETHEINNDGNIGYEFIPTINNAGINDTLNLQNHDDVVARFKKWAAIAKFADELYCTEFYPLDYIDE